MKASDLLGDDEIHHVVVVAPRWRPLRLYIDGERRRAWPWRVRRIARVIWGAVWGLPFTSGS